MSNIVGSKVRYLKDGWFSKGDVLYVIKYDSDDGKYVLSPDNDSCECSVISLWVEKEEFELISDYEEYSEYGRKPLDDYSTGELQAEVDRRQAKEDARKIVEEAIEDIRDNIDNTTLIKKSEYLNIDYYEFEVRKL